MEEYYVLVQKPNLYRVMAETPERAEEIVRKNPTITSKGNILQAFGVDPDDEGKSSLIVDIPDTYSVYRVGEIGKQEVHATEYEKARTAINYIMEKHGAKLPNYVTDTLYKIKQDYGRNK